MVRQVLKRLPGLSRLNKRLILLVYDLAAMTAALWAAFSTRLGIFYSTPSRSVVASAALSFICGLAGLYALRIYHIVLRYFDLRTVSRLLAAAAIAAFSWVAAVYLMYPHITVDNATFMVPRSVAFIYGGFLFLLLFMGRYVMALLLSSANRDIEGRVSERRNILIYGANAAGISLADSVRSTSTYKLVGFVDAEGASVGQLIGGAPVYPPDALAQLAQYRRIDEVFLAMP